MILILMMMMILTIALILIKLNFLISMKSLVSREKSSIFECGFDPSSSSRLPFSMHFFLVALIFLIFDVEISLLIPLPYTWNMLNSPSTLWLILSVIAILLGGTLIEWIEGSLDWHL